MALARAVCPRCHRSYGRTVRVCLVDGAVLVEESRLAESEAAETTTPFPRESDVLSSAPPPLYRRGGPTTPRAVVPPLPGAPGTAVILPPHARPTPLPFEATAGARRDVTNARGFERLGPYRLLRLLGEGGMARIYLAEHEKLGRICAIKRLHADHFTDRLTVARFLAEARAVADITHPNLIAAYDVVEEPNEIYLVMEYLDGRDLAQVIRDDGPLAPVRAADVAAQACDGLAAVHARNIIHRDLKPENIFLTRDPDGTERVKLLDFGVARLVGDRPKELKTRSGLTVGTPSYMSPEQATASEIDARSDIYTIGVVLYEMLAGAPPFTGAGYGDVMLMHVNDPPPRLSTRRRDVPPGLEEVVMRCLEKEPEARFQSAVELAVALRQGRPTGRMSGRMNVVTPKDSRTLRNQKVAPPRRWLWLGAGALAAGAAAIGIAVWAPWSSGGASAPSTVAASSVPVAPPAPSSPRPTPLHPVRVTTTPPGAEVLVDGERRCTTPCDAAIADGRGHATIEVRAPGFLVESRLVDAAAPPTELRLALRRDPLAAAPPPEPANAPAAEAAHHPGRRSSHGAHPRTLDRNGTVNPFDP